MAFARLAGFPVAIVLVLVLEPPRASADTLHLRGGGELVGDVVPDGESYRVLLSSGVEVTIPAEDVVRVEPGDTFRDEYIRRVNHLDRMDAEAHYVLGLFCADHGLRQEAEMLFRTVVRIVPDHEGARASLGEVRHEGAWMPLEESLRRQGQVPHGGRWVTPEEKERLLFKERVRFWDAEVRRLSYRLRSTSAEKRERARRDLAAIEEPAALGALVELGGHWHADLRRAAAPALARLAATEPAAAARLVRMATRDEDVTVQDAAAAAVGAGRVEPVADLVLLEYLEADEANVRKAAANALGIMRYKPAFEPLARTLYFTVLRNRMVPTGGLGPMVGRAPRYYTPEDPFGRRRLLIRSYELQRGEYRVVADTAFNDAARAGLKAICGVDYDFDRTGWLRWWDENESRFDPWMGEAVTPSPASKRAP